MSALPLLHKSKPEGNVCFTLTSQVKTIRQCLLYPYFTIQNQKAMSALPLLHKSKPEGNVCFTLTSQVKTRRQCLLYPYFTSQNQKAMSALPLLHKSKPEGNVCFTLTSQVHVSCFSSKQLLLFTFACTQPFIEWPSQVDEWSGESRVSAVSGAQAAQATTYECNRAFVTGKADLHMQIRTITPNVWRCDRSS